MASDCTPSRLQTDCRFRGSGAHGWLESLLRSSEKVQLNFKTIASVATASLYELDGYLSEENMVSASMNFYCASGSIAISGTKKDGQCTNIYYSNTVATAVQNITTRLLLYGAHSSGYFIAKSRVESLCAHSCIISANELSPASVPFCFSNKSICFLEDPAQGSRCSALAPPTTQRSQRDIAMARATTANDKHSRLHFILYDCLVVV